MHQALFWLTLLCLIAIGTCEFRSFSGVGSNDGLGVQTPFLRGAYEGREYRGRMTYEEDGQTPMTSGLRGPREISNIVVNLKEQTLPEDESQVSLMHNIWGQFIEHDMFRSEPGEDTMSIPVPPNDPVLAGIVDMMQYQRAVWVNGSTATRDQINTVTAFIDGSGIYGTSPQINGYLRVNGDCELSMESGPDGMILPRDTHGYMDNDGNSIGKVDPEKLFLAGDARVNENPALTALHTLFVREHNRLCKAFENDVQDKEERFQVARKWVIALIQQVTYNEYIPSTLGNPLPPWAAYDISLDPTIDSVFAAATFRFGYSEANPAIPAFNPETLERMADISLPENFFNPDYIATNGVDAILAGLGRVTQSRADPFYAAALRTFVFGSDPRQPVHAATAQVGVGIDLAAKTIQMGRDFGLPRYNELRDYFGLARKFEFSEITSDPRLAIALELAYPAGVDTIDAFIGGLAEDRTSISHMGPLFTASLREQFTRLRDGDRFYFENTEVSKFTIEELGEIKRTKLADILLRNTQIKRAQCSMFYTAASNEELDCGEPTITSTQEHLLGEKDAVLSYQEIDDNKIKITVRAKHDGWIAVGIPESQTSPRMLGADAIIGYFNALGNGMVEDYKIGGFTQDVYCPEGVCYDSNTLVGGRDDIIGGSITKDGEFTTLQFTRLRVTNDTKGDISFAPKGESQVILLAMGKMAMVGRLGYHEHFKTFLSVGPESKEIDFSTLQITPTEQETPATGEAQIKKLYQFTSSITTLDGVDVYWTPHDDSIDFAVTSPLAGYVSLGFTGPDNTGMLGSLAVLGWAGSDPKISTYFLGGYSPEEVVETDQLNVTNARVSTINGKTLIQFTVPIDGSWVTSNGEPTQVIAAVCDECYSIQEHTAHTSAAVSIDFASGVTKEAPFAWTLLHTHGVLMTFAWAVGIPFGVLFARYGKAFGNTSWFPVHQFVNLGSYLIAFAGLIVAIVYYAGLQLNRAHSIMGFIIMILGALQIAYGFLRPHVPAKGEAKSIPRYIFEIVHVWHGRLLLMAVIATIVLGLIDIKAPMPFLIAFGAYIAVILVLVLVLELYNVFRVKISYQLAEATTPVKVEKVEMASGTDFVS